MGSRILARLLHLRFILQFYHRFILGCVQGAFGWGGKVFHTTPTPQPKDGAFACTRASLCEELKTNIFTIYFLFPVSISCNLNLLFKYLIKYLNYDKFLEDFLRYLFPSEFENFSNILVFFKNDAHLFLNYFLHIVNWGPCFIIIGWLGFSIGRTILKFYYY